MNRSLLKKIAILAAILAFPSIAYYLLHTKGKNRYKPLNIFGPKVVSNSLYAKKRKQVPDTIYHRVSDFTLTDQDHNTLFFTTTQGKLTVVSFFYTRCTLRCSQQAQAALSRVAKQYEKNKWLQFFSITVDPDFDTVTELKKYSSRYAIGPNWHFLTGDPSTIYKLAKEDFLIDALRDTLQPTNIIHSNLLILLDSKKKIRGYYDSTIPEQVDRLSEEIKVLIAEEIRNASR